MNNISPRILYLTFFAGLPTGITTVSCGLFISGALFSSWAAPPSFSPGNPEALAEAMGKKGRGLAERYYNIEWYAKGLHTFFESL